jgi:MarR family transcriptional regulator, organic hydroperoxide resistance regulator
VSLIISFLIGYQEADMDSEKHSKPEKRVAEMRRIKTLMRRLMVHVRARLDDELRVKKVTTAQLRFLHEVKERPGSSGAQMARACYVTPQSAQAMMARAVERGWVVRGTDAENHRLVTARLTPAGERLLVYADGVLTRLEAEIWAGVSLGELREMNGVIERALANLED